MLNVIPGGATAVAAEYSDRMLKGRDVRSVRLPQRLRVNAMVDVAKYVSKIRDVCPRYRGMLIFHRLWQVA